MGKLEDEILRLGQEQPLPEKELRRLLHTTLAELRQNHPEDFEGRSDNEIIEDVLAQRRALAFVMGLARLEGKK